MNKIFFISMTLVVLGTANCSENRPAQTVHYPGLECELTQGEPNVECHNTGRMGFLYNPPEYQYVEAPVEIPVTVTLADDVSPPQNGRMALLVFPYNSHQLFTQQLPGDLPATITMDFGAFPDDIVEQAVADFLDFADMADLPQDERDAEFYIGGLVVVYDDVNGDGQAQYEDEVISLVPLWMSWHFSYNDGQVSEGIYQIALEVEQCEEIDGCTHCWTDFVGFDLEGGVSVTVKGNAGGVPALK